MVARPSVFPRHHWDCNRDGFAHYGLFPEFLQSLRNAGMTPAIEDLFMSSAESFAQMWEKAERRRAAVTLP